MLVCEIFSAALNIVGASVAAVKNQAAVLQRQLGDIAPSWDRRLKQLPASKWSLKWLRWHLDMLSRETCIVGEAYGRSPAYWDGCAECRAFSSGFNRNFRECSYKELEDGVQRFVEHWNEKHADVRDGRGLRWFDSFARFDSHIRIF